MLVQPLHLLTQNAAIRHSFSDVRVQLVHLVRAPELQLVERGAVPNHDLRRVLVRHHYRGRRQLRPLRVRVVACQRLRAHAHVGVRTLLES